MKRSVLLVLMALLLCTSTMAQLTPPGVRKPNRAVLHARGYQIAIGPSAGFGMAMSAASEVYGLNPSCGISYRYGLITNARFGNLSHSSKSSDNGTFGVSLEAFWGNRKLKLPDASIQLNCLEIPILGQFYPLPFIGVEAGATIVKFLDFSPDVIHTASSIMHTGQISGGDIMFSMGACYKSPKGLSLSARYNLGCSNLAGNLDIKVSTLMMSVSYLFTIIK